MPRAKTNWLRYWYHKQRKTLIGQSTAITERGKNWLAAVLPSQREGNTDWMQYCPPQTEENTNWLKYCPHGQRDRNQVLLLWILAYTFPLLYEMHWVRFTALPSSVLEPGLVASEEGPLGSQLRVLTFYFDSAILFQALATISSQSNHPSAYWDSSGYSACCSWESSKPHIQCHSLCQLLSAPIPSALHCTSTHESIALCVHFFLPHTSFAIEILLIKIDAEPLALVGSR